MRPCTGTLGGRLGSLWSCLRVITAEWDRWGLNQAAGAVLSSLRPTVQPQDRAPLLPALPVQRPVQNVISHPAVYFPVTFHLVSAPASSHLPPFSLPNLGSMPLSHARRECSQPPSSPGA